MAGFVLAGLMYPAFDLAGGKADLQAIVDNSTQDVKAFKTHEDVKALLNKAYGVMFIPKLPRPPFSSVAREVPICFSALTRRTTKHKEPAPFPFLVHNAYRSNLKGESKRKYKTDLTQNK